MDTVSAANINTESSLYRRTCLILGIGARTNTEVTTMEFRNKKKTAKNTLVNTTLKAMKLNRLDTTLMAR